MSYHHHSSHSPFGTPTTLVDKFIGSAYDTVKYVARHMGIVAYVAENMDSLKEVLSNLRKELLVEAPLVLDQNNQATITLAPTLLDVSRITDYGVLITTALGDIYASGSGAFVSRIVNGSLVITIHEDFVPVLIGGSIKWSITYNEG